MMVDDDYDKDDDDGDDDENDDDCDISIQMVTERKNSKIFRETQWC